MFLSWALCAARFSGGFAVNNIVPANEFSCCRAATCCFTGHRDRDLPFGGDVHRQGMKNLLSMLVLMIKEAYADGCRTFISGMSKGIDLRCAEIVHSLSAQKEYSDMELVCVLPYAGQRSEMKTPLDSYTYSLLLESCSAVVITSPRYEKGCYKKRNSFMVDHSSRMIGVIREKAQGSGTLQTINMAKRAGLALNIISLDDNPVFYIDDDGSSLFVN